MRFFLLVFPVLAVGCGASLSLSDAGPVADAGTFDAGAPDAGVTYASHIQPLLWEKCSNCHSGDAGYAAFAKSYPVLLTPSTRCPGARVGDCVKRALEAQAVEGTGCRTYIVEPFHREAWACLTAAEVDRVVGWVDAGMPEQ
jgi:hypothetical protein